MRQAGRSELALLGIALALGVLADGLLRAFPLGLNGTLVAASLTLGLFAVQRAEGRGAERWALALASLLIGLGFCWRDSPVLKWLDALAAGGVLALLASSGRQAASLSHYALRVGRTSVFVVPGPLPAMTEVRWRDVGSPLSGRVVFGLVRGLFLATPVLLVFAVLLGKADPVFAMRLQDLVAVDVSEMIGHAAGVVALGWIAAGLLWAGFHPTQGRLVPPRPAWLSLGSIEVGTLLGLVDLLFAGFVWVQFRYLFGGTDWVEGVAGLTYSQYARRGFFELVAVTTLSLPLLLVMLASALERMRVYQSQYGQTELRFYTTAFMLWLGVLLVSFMVTVLPGRRGAFARLALGSAFAALALLHAVNPDARIVIANRAAPRAFDLDYALSLSADAVPAIVQTAPSLPPEARQAMAWRLMARWSAPEADFRIWSFARERARQEVARAGWTAAYSAGIP